MDVLSAMGWQLVFAVECYDIIIGEYFIYIYIYMDVY